jgi:hypothetical protein
MTPEETWLRLLQSTPDFQPGDAVAQAESCVSALWVGFRMAA